MTRAFQQSLFDADGEHVGRQSVWRQRYSSQHNPVRIREFPAGIAGPNRVRIYQRKNSYLLQWWDPSHKKSLSERIDGDLLDAVMRAREIESRLMNFGNTGHAAAQLTHEQLVAAFTADLTKRADAGEIDPGTVERYRAPLQRHYLAFVVLPDIARRYRFASKIDREFQLEFSRFLKSRQLTPNGKRGASRPMRGQQYVFDVVRSMVHWATDRDRGNLLPQDFPNPFRRTKRTAKIQSAGLSEPDITVEMAVEVLSACDRFQLPIFATLVLYGLRPDELGWVFWEDVHDGWVRIANHPELSYQTKGRRDKQFPAIECLRAIWPQPREDQRGLLFHRRRHQHQVAVPLSKAALVETFNHEAEKEVTFSAAAQRRNRDRVMNRAGRLSYDDVEAEFGELSKRLKWPKRATLKDFRHLFATSLENAGVPESYRRFLMGHSPGRAAIVSYTHLNKLKLHYMRAIDTELGPLVAAIQRRAVEIELPRSAS